jgi:hypothetical protein
MNKLSGTNEINWKEKRKKKRKKKKKKRKEKNPDTYQIIQIMHGGGFVTNRHNDWKRE